MMGEIEITNSIVQECMDYLTVVKVLAAKSDFKTALEYLSYVKQTCETLDLHLDNLYFEQAMAE